MSTPSLTHKESRRQLPPSLSLSSPFPSYVPQLLPREAALEPQQPPPWVACLFPSTVSSHRSRESLPSPQGVTAAVAFVAQPAARKQDPGSQFSPCAATSATSSHFFTLLLVLLCEPSPFSYLISSYFQLKFIKFMRKGLNFV